MENVSSMKAQFGYRAEAEGHQPDDLLRYADPRELERRGNQISDAAVEKA